MKKKIVWRNAALMVLMSAIALTMFTENVRTVQVLGLFFCGAAFGAAMSMLIVALRANGQQSQSPG